MREAFAVEYVTIGWMAIELVAALYAGTAAHSISLTAFGVDSGIELLSAGVLVWRLNVELRRGEAFAERAERRAQRIAGGLLFALAAYVVAAAAWSVWRRTGEAFSWPGLLVTLAAIPIMYGLAKRKLKLAEQLNSGALRADAVESITCGWLSFVVVVGLAADFLLRAWWVDAATSLPILYLLIKEGREAWEGDDCCDD